MFSLLVLAIALLPVYLFRSGGPQIVDIPIFLLILFNVFNFNKVIDVEIKKQVYFVIPFLAWVSFINIFYYLLNGNDISLILSTITIIYNIIILYTFAIYFDFLFKGKSTYILYLALFLSVFIIFLITGSHEETVRSTLSFNNPNQLGYFSVILLSFVIILLNTNEILNILSTKYMAVFVMTVLLAAHHLVFLSLSRGAFFSVLVLDVAFLKTIIKNKIYLIFGTLLLIVGSLVVFPNLPYITGRMEARGEEHSFNLEKNIIQSYERVTSQLIFSSPWQVIFGRGDRWIHDGENVLSYEVTDATAYPEVHNIFGNVLRAYGIIGLLCFAVWIGKFIWASRVIPGTLWVWAALFCYNMTHNGIRFRAFWILLAFILAIITYLKSTQNLEKQTIS